MNCYLYFWLGFSAVGIIGLIPFIKLVSKTKKLSGWEETYEREFHKEWKELKTIEEIDGFYNEKESGSYLDCEFLLERKAYLLSVKEEPKQKKEFAKDMIPLLIRTILPEIIALFFLGVNKDVELLAFICAIVFLALYLIAVFFFSFKLLSMILNSTDTPDALKAEYELKCIDKLIDRHFKNV